MNLTDKEKFMTILESHKGVIYKVANSYCRDEDDRKDLVQEIIIQLWQSFHKYNDQYKITTWMYRIALNVAISSYRKKSTRMNSSLPITDHVINIGDTESSVDLETNVTLLQKFIQELQELDKALMILYLEENSYREIADILGITETNVASKISRVKEKLKQRFQSINHS